MYLNTKSEGTSRWNGQGRVMFLGGFLQLRFSQSGLTQVPYFQIGAGGGGEGVQYKEGVHNREEGCPPPSPLLSDPPPPALSLEFPVFNIVLLMGSLSDALIQGGGGEIFFLSLRGWRAEPSSPRSSKKNLWGVLVRYQDLS